MSKTIETDRYCWALETWASLPRPNKVDREAAEVKRVCDHLRAAMLGDHPVASLCAAFREHVGDDSFTRHLLIDIAKSCLLYRLIYADEPLRSRRCPVHKGVWSGWSFEPCACSFGPNLTGWLPEEAMTAIAGRDHGDEHAP
jgi:hypothetical protein